MGIAASPAKSSARSRDHLGVDQRRPSCGGSTVSSPVLALVLSATVAAGGTDRRVRDPELDPIRAGVINLRDGAQTDGWYGLVGNLIAASIAISLAVIIGADVIETESTGGITKPLIVTALSIAAATQLADGLYNVLAQPATVISAEELLEDDEALDQIGMFFLRDRARDGKDRRIRSIITDATTSAGTIVSGVLLLTNSNIQFGGKNILAGITIGIGVIQIAQALFKLFTKSTEEKVYEAVLKAYGEDEPGGPDLSLQMIIDREEKATVGAAVGFSF
jgi:hypothetical protein